MAQITFREFPLVD